MVEERKLNLPYTSWFLCSGYLLFVVNPFCEAGLHHFPSKDYNHRVSVFICVNMTEHDVPPPQPPAQSGFQIHRKTSDRSRWLLIFMLEVGNVFSLEITYITTILLKLDYNN